MSDQQTPTVLWKWAKTHRASVNLRRFRSEEHTSELQSQSNIVCRLLLEKKQEDRGEEYLQQTIASLQGIRKLYQRGLRESVQLRLEHKLSRGKKSQKFSRLKRTLSRSRR